MREFTITSGGVTLANQAVTLVFVNPTSAPNVNIEFLRFWIGQTATNTSSQQRCSLVTQSSSFPTVVSTTAQPLKLTDATASVLTGNTSGGRGTYGVNASAESTGTKISYWEDAFNVLNGWLHVPTPPETKVINAGYLSASTSAGIGMYLPVAATSLAGWSFGLVYREI